MDYITLADAKTLLGRTLAVYTTDGTVDDDHLTLVLEEAEGMVNAAIASRYTIPATETQAVNFIRSLIIPIARYKTYVQFADQEDFPAGVLEEYKGVLKQLDMLAKQITSLPSESDKTTGRAASIKISTTTSPIEGF